MSGKEASVLKDIMKSARTWPWPDQAGHVDEEKGDTV